jgi:DNA-binding CsgD family transcriptional regulator
VRDVDEVLHLATRISPARTRAVLSPGTGTPARPPGTRSRPQFGWQGLTPTEHSVASLVAEGLSNPQIGARLYISHRTVQTYLAHIFAKLDISARTQLPAEVTRRRRDEMGE